MSQSVGLWLIGARGGVATVATTGLLALQKGLADQCGLVTGLPQFGAADLIDWNQLLIGGHDIRSGSLVEQAGLFQESSRAFSPGLIEATRTELDEVDQRIRPGILHQCGQVIDQLADTAIREDASSVAQKLQQVESDLIEFRESNRLDRVIVINVSSTELPISSDELPATWDQASQNLDSFPASSLYAIAAMRTGCAYVNFTPSVGSDCAAIADLAIQSGVLHAGRDGKTGETLIKSALAPVFAMRNLNVMSWVGHNIFGNMDGLVLDDPQNKKTKVQSKDQLLGEILGYHPQSHISIEYIKSLGDWKTAWDHIHFQGFLGTPMVMQFTWQGCDSILAAPLVLDLARLTERAIRAGQSGVMPWLACFFKSPMGVPENRIAQQFALLEDWLQGLND